MKRVLIDVDGVIANFSQLYLDCLREATGMHRTVEEIKVWDVGDALGLTRTERAAVHSQLQLPGRAFSMRNYPHTIEAVQKLAAHADVYFVTSPFPSPTWTFDRDQWLQVRFGELGKRVTYTHDKHICSGDVLVDDKPENVVAWIKENYPGCAVLWAQPYNELAYDQAMRLRGVVRTNDWSRVFELAGVPLL